MEGPAAAFTIGWFSQEKLAEEEHREGGRRGDKQQLGLCEVLLKDDLSNTQEGKTGQRLSGLHRTGVRGYVSLWVLNGG